MKHRIYLKSLVAKADGEIDTETKKVIIFKNSIINPNVTNSLSSTIKKLRHNLIQEGKIVDFVLVNDIEFNSPSAAASLIKGTPEGLDGFILESTQETLTTLFPNERPDLISFLLANYTTERELSWTGNNSLETFNRFFKLEDLKTITWERYDKTKDQTTLMYFLERQLSEFGSGMMGENSHKLFYFDSKFKKYTVAPEIKNDIENNGLNDDQIFRKYMLKFYEFISSFHRNNYNPKAFIPKRNIIKAKMLHIFKPYQITAINGKRQIMELLTFLKLPFSDEDDSVKLNIILTNYLFKVEPSFEKNNFNLYILSDLLWDYYEKYVKKESFKSIELTFINNVYDCNTGLTSSDYVDFLKSSGKISENQLKTLNTWKNQSDFISTKELVNKKAGTFGDLRNHIQNIGAAIGNYFSLKIKKGSYESNLNEEDSTGSKYWPFVCSGKYLTYDGGKVFGYKLKPELIEALNFIDVNSEDKISTTNITQSDDIFIEDERISKLKQLLKRKKNIILTGSPGVGKTFIARTIVDLIQPKPEIVLVQFHQSYTYEDFIQGYAPSKNLAGSFEIKNGIFYEFVKKAIANPKQDFVMIIDEINRGNLSKIFGELLLSIEPDKRSQKYEVDLAHSNEKFFVPANVYIIGTMNTADKSLSQIDYALRRRFSYFSIEPGFHNPKLLKHLVDNGVAEDFAKKVIQKMIQINDDIHNDVSLGKGFKIGHSYFCNPSENDIKWYEDIIEFEIIPILEEYFFDNEQKLKIIKELLNN